LSGNSKGSKQSAGPSNLSGGPGLSVYNAIEVRGHNNQSFSNTHLDIKKDSISSNLLLSAGSNMNL